MNFKTFRKKYRWLWRTTLAIGIFTLTIFGIWEIAPYCVDDPLPDLLNRSPAHIYYDINGVAMYAHTGENAQWRFDVPLSEISPDVIRATLIAEDANFYDHNGVDYFAAFRALWQNITSLKTISGASTISMQVASLATGRNQSLWGKFLQAARARKMERCHTKDEILTAYLNHVPYGGKITGIEAASQYYFNTSAKELTFSEATLLAGIPQRPNAFRLDRHFEIARKRQKRLLEMMVKRGQLTPTESNNIFQTAGIRCRNYNEPASFQKIASPDEHFHALKAGYPIRSDWQSYALTRLREHLSSIHNVNDGACIVIDRHAPNAPVLYIGTLNFNDPKNGQVDAARAKRSAGSILKPFIYAIAIQGGEIVPETKLLDAPLRYKNYTPSNYDNHYRGWCSAKEALADSLNTPVIRLHQAIGNLRLKTAFQALDLPFNEDLGLTASLGTGGVSLLQLTYAYHNLPKVFSPETEILLAHSLRRPLPHTQLDVAWKTGTANNNTDAWCIGWTPDYVVGVWLGNKNGMRSESLVGVTAAAPIVGDLFNLLYKHRPKPFWEEPSTINNLCKQTGLRASSKCKESFKGFTHSTVPLLQCQCHLATSATTPLILSPIATTYCGDSVTLPLIATASDVHWMLNEQPVNSTQIVLSPGNYTLRAFTATQIETIHLIVLPKESLRAH
jgi:penicillin-binding protein 1C